jgi:CelD/BcsL family acetyltransferase involved in cellulose biosynthesis
VTVRCTFEGDASRLRGWVAAWQALAKRALEPNPFFEPWFLLPALRHLPELASVTSDAGCGVLFIEEQDGALIGVVPLRLEPLRALTGRIPLPLMRARVLTHKYSFCHTPLVDRAGGARAIAALLGWCRARRAPVLELEDTYADGPVHELLLEEARHLGSAATFVRGAHERAVFLPRADASAFLAAAMTPKRRRDLERRERQLRAAGHLETPELGPGPGPDAELVPFVDGFLALEAAGWKGAAGTAFASAATDRDFFVEAVRAGHAEGRVWFQTVELDGATIASLLSFVAGASAYSWKICYDERMARYSPGVYVEVLNLRRLHERPQITWMDSGARPDHPMVNRLWPDRKRIETRWFATGGALPAAFVRSLPLAARLKTRLTTLRRRPDPGPVPSAGEPPPEASGAPH